MTCDCLSSAQFTYLVIGTIPLDIIWMWNNGQGWFIKLLTILILVLKVRELHGVALLRGLKRDLDTHRYGVCNSPADSWR